MNPEPPSRRPANDQHGNVQGKAGRRRRQTGVGIQKADDDRHVGPADANDHENAQQQSN